MATTKGREAVRNIEAETIIAKMNNRLQEEAAEKERPKRRIDEMGDSTRSALVDSAVKIVNLIREKAGAEPIDDLPLAQPGDAGGCVLARAFDQHGTVGGGSIEWSDEAWNEAANEVFEEGGEGHTHNPATFQNVVSEFDSGGMYPYTVDETERETQKAQFEAQRSVRAEDLRLSQVFPKPE